MNTHQSQIKSNHKFSQTGLSQSLCKLLQSCKYFQPTPIQYHSIKASIQNPECSLVCRSKSGTGKTLAYLSICLQSLLSQPPQPKTSCLILLPTRQLAVQVYQTLKSLTDSTTAFKAVTQQQKTLKSRLSALNMMLTIGGISFEDDRKRYRENPAHVIVATVGRIWEIFRDGFVGLGGQLVVVFDEGDRLLGRGDQKLGKVVQALPNNARWLVYSATYNNKLLNDLIKQKKIVYIETLLKNHKLQVTVTDKLQQIIKTETKQVNNQQKVNNKTANQPKLVEQQINMNNGQNLHLQNIKKYYIKTTPQKTDSIFDCKLKTLITLLTALPYKKCLIFVQKKSFLDQLSQSLSHNELDHVLIHGSLSQAARFRMMNRINSTKIILASDLLARGIDIRLDLVILFDARQTENFWHRIGRTGRYGREGVAISLDAVDGDDRWKQYVETEVVRLLGDIENIQKKEWYGGHMTEIGRWEQVDVQKQAQNNYKYFNEQNAIKNISRIQHSIKQQNNSDLNVQNSKQSTKQILSKIKSKQQLQKFVKQKILNCEKCMQLVKGTTALTGYKFQLFQYLNL